MSKIKDVIGEKHFRFTITNMLPSKVYGKHNYKYVEVTCECGNKRNICYKDLKKGKSKSCGCLAEELKIKVNKGDKYGLWTVITEGDGYFKNNIKHDRTFLCECICGKEKEVNLRSLVSGSSKSCGCQGKPPKEEIKRHIEPIPTSTEDEQWKEAFGYEGYYVSTEGRLFTTLGKNRFINKTNNITAELWNNQVRTSMHLPTVIYKTFKHEFDESEYKLIHIDDNTRNFKLNNLFLARLTSNGRDWVTRAFSTMNASGKEKSGQRKKIKTLKKKHIIEQYIKQEGLSTFLKLPLDLTGKDSLLGVSVDRIDNDKDYEEGNITLVTRFENMGRRSATFEHCMEFCSHLKYDGGL